MGSKPSQGLAPACITLLFALLVLLAPPTWADAAPQRIVPAEWRSTITGTINTTVVFHGNALKSAAQQAVLLLDNVNGGGSNKLSTSTLWRADLLSIFHVAPGSSAINSSCTRSQLYNSEILLLLDFLLAPGTEHQGVTTINGRQCDIWVSPFELNTPWGKYVCLETSASLAYQLPVRYWLKLPGLDFVVDFEDDFKAAGAIPSSEFAVPTNCPHPDITQPLPVGLSDSFDKDTVESFWMPPLKKYYTYEPGHITIERDPAKTGGRAARVSMQPGDVRNAGTERDELDLPMIRLGGQELYYSWRFMLGEDFGFSRNRIVIGQWKQSSLFTQSPVVSLRLKRKKLVLGVRNLTMELADDDRMEFVLEEEMEVGKWYNVKFGLFFSHEMDGFVKVWIDGRKAAAFSGPTMSMADQGYFDFHFGVYRNAWNVTQTLLLDSFLVSGNESSAVGAHG